jgi:hypothetical protein
MPKPKKRREYLQYLDAAISAAERAIDTFNSVWSTYRDETTLLLLANAWELLAKAVLLHLKESIAKGTNGDSISGETAVLRLETKKLLTSAQAATIQQVVSLRNAACHGVLPLVPPEIMQHLLFYSLKFFRELVQSKFPSHAKRMSENYLSAAFSPLTTYADKVQKAVAKVRSSNGDKRLVWLLERGVAFDGNGYMTESQLEKKYQNKHKILPHLALSEFLKAADMVRVVPVEAPKNFTADISLRKGKAGDSSLPVIVTKTDVDKDFPYLTKELGLKLGKNQNWAAHAVSKLGLKNDPKFHQAVRAGAHSYIHRYSEAALSRLREKLAADPAFNPFK